MTISAVEITQDNIIDSIDLMAVHNPLVFIAKVTWNTTAPNNIAVLVYLTGESISSGGSYEAIYLDDISATERRFLFISEEALRLQMDTLEDVAQTVNTIINIDNLIKELDIRFDDEVAFSDTVEIIACHAARDFENENGATMVDVFNNESHYYVGAVGQDLYLYWWNDNAANVIDGTESIPLPATTDEAVNNTKEYIINNVSYNTWIKGLATTSDIWCYVFETPPSSQVVFEAQNGQAVTFSNVLVGASTTYAITSNGTSSARLTFTVNSVPSNGDTFDFDFVTPTTGGTINLDEHYGTTGGDTYDRGFIRKKLNPTIAGEQTETINIAGVDYPHTVNVRQWCTGDQLLKYVDSNGFYRFFPFTRFYQRKGNPTPIGTINELVLSLADDPGDTKEIGYKNKNSLILSAAQLNESEKALLEDLYNSPEVFILSGTKWVSVTVKGDNISKLAKKNFSDLNIEVILPQSYNVTLL